MIFRWLVFPLGVISLFLCLVLATVAVFGENPPVVNGRELRGLTGALQLVAFFPVLTLFLSLVVSFGIYFDRLKTRKRS
jgi:hypothetical protein